MNAGKANTKEILEVVEQQKKLKELKNQLNGVLMKVQESINSITVSVAAKTAQLNFPNFLMFQVENLELMNSQISNFEDSPAENDSKANIHNEIQQQYDQRAEEVNQQLINLEMNMSQYEVESDEEIEDLGALVL